jgi:endonuclease
MRLIVARCSVTYTGPLSPRLPEALRLLTIKSDGSAMVHADTGDYKPQNWRPTHRHSDDAVRAPCA